MEKLDKILNNSYVTDKLLSCYTKFDSNKYMLNFYYIRDNETSYQIYIKLELKLTKNNNLDISDNDLDNIYKYYYKRNWYLFISYKNNNYFNVIKLER